MVGGAEGAPVSTADLLAPLNKFQVEGPQRPSKRFAARHEGAVGPTGEPRSSETPNPLGSPEVPRHTVGSYGGSVSYERGAPVHHPPHHLQTHLTECIYQFALESQFPHKSVN